MSLLSFYSPTSPMFATPNLPSSETALSSRPSIPPSTAMEHNGQLPTPSSSFHREESQGESASSSYRTPSANGFRPSPPPSSSSTSNIQPTQSITQEIFRITQLLLSLDSHTKKSIKDTDRKLENLEETIDTRLKAFGEALDGLVVGAEDERSEIKSMVNGLNGRLESLERICRSMSRSGSALGITTAEDTINSNGLNANANTSNHSTQTSSQPYISLDRNLHAEETPDLINEDQRSYDVPQHSGFAGIEDIANNTGDDYNDQDIFMDIDDEFQPADMEVGVNPQDIMRPPSIINDQPQTEEVEQSSSGRTMRKKVAAVLARERNENHVVDDLTETPNADPQPAATRNTRSRKDLTTASPMPSGSSATDEGGDASPIAESPKPLPRLRFPPREPVSTSPVQSNRKGRLSGNINTQTPISSTSSSQPKKRGRPWGSKNKNKTTSPTRPISVSSKTSPESDIQILDDEPECSTRPKRRKSNVKPNINEDKKPRYDREKYTKSGTARVRKFKGQVRLAIKCLAPSDGHKITDATWPNKGPNTARGRLEEIVCDACKGRCHWSCAGLPEDKDMSQETWLCPDCTYRIEEEGIARILIETTQQLNCIRYNCILREKRALERQEGEEERYFVEKVVGRRAIARVPDSSKRIFEYLVKWDGYELFDCTWEPLANLEHHSERLLRKFEESARRTKCDLHPRVCLLPEAKTFWNETTGEPILVVDKDENSDSDENDEDEVEDHQSPIIDHDNEDSVQIHNMDQEVDVVVDAENAESSGTNQSDKAHNRGTDEDVSGGGPSEAGSKNEGERNLGVGNEDMDVSMTIGNDEQDASHEDNADNTQLPLFYPDTSIEEEEEEIPRIDKGKGKEIVAEDDGDTELDARERSIQREEEIDALEEDGYNEETTKDDDNHEDSTTSTGRSIFGIRLF